MHNFSNGRWIERRTQFVVLYSWTDAVDAFVLLHVISSLSVIFLFVVVVVGFFFFACIQTYFYVCSTERLYSRMAFAVTWWIPLKCLCLHA